MLLQLSLGLLGTAKHIMPHALCMTAFYYGPQQISKQTTDQECAALFVIRDKQILDPQNLSSDPQNCMGDRELQEAYMSHPSVVYAAQCVRLAIGVADAFQQSCFHAKSSRRLLPG